METETYVIQIKRTINSEWVTVCEYQDFYPNCYTALSESTCGRTYGIRVLKVIDQEIREVK